MKAFIAIAVGTFISVSAFAQEGAGIEQPRIGEKLPAGTVTRGYIYEGDTIPWICLGSVNISAERTFKNKKQAQRWSKLKRDVKKVYPYAILASAKLKEYNRIMAGMPEMQRKVYMKKAEEDLKKEFEDELKKLTITQGRILIKLIDRETGNTSYDLVKDLRGSFQAFMWQSVARLFGSNLKSEYDADGDDKMIEDIIHLVEAGEI